MTASNTLLEVQDLTVSVALEGHANAIVVNDVSFSLDAGATLGLVGESGSGKTMTALAIMGLLPAGARIESGRILLRGEDLLLRSPRQMRQTRGRMISMVLQDPMTALDPSFTIGSQIKEPLRIHRKLRGAALNQALADSLVGVQLKEATERVKDYPHQFSGGMRQRVTSAIALAGEPKLLIADEPTTALDVTTQARYLQLLKELQAETGFGLLFVSHDLLLVRHLCQRVAVMYAGQIVETGTTEEIFARSQHPYTQALMGAIVEIDKSKTLTMIDGQAPDITDEFEGCRFAPRCGFATDICLTHPPRLTERDPDHTARCWGTEAGGWIS